MEDRPLTRAELKRFQREAAKTPTYNLNPEQIQKIKDDAARRAIETSFIMTLGIPVLMLKDHFGQLIRKTVDGKSREERFAEYCLEFYRQFTAGYYTLDDIEKVLKQECGIRVETLYESMKNRVI